MDLSCTLRRRRARAASSRQKVILCACLGLGAQTIVPTAEAWAPAATLWYGRGPPTQSTSTSRRTAVRGAFSHRPPGYVGGNNNRGWQAMRAMPAVAGVSGGGGGGSGWGTTAPTAVGAVTFRQKQQQQSVRSAFSSRSSSSSGRPAANAIGAGVAGRRRRTGVMMSMAEDDGGTESDGYNAALGALAIASLGVLYYGLHDRAGVGIGGLDGLDTGSHSAFLKTIIDAAKAGPTAATTAAQAFLTNSVTKIEQLGPVGAVYFGLLYVLAEVLIIPALPLTTAAGYLFGVAGGTAVVLVSATVAAAISFQLGRTLLRTQVEGILEENLKFRALDKAIGKEGFKVILLLRLSPIFPFALSNYFYGVTSVDFLEYMFGTLIGFAPGSLAYVYTGTLGKAMTDGASMTLPWYGYVAGGALVAFLLKTVGEIATTAIEEMEEAEK
ncbi:unnamed protein product [Pylaiella littoralis]